MLSHFMIDSINLLIIPSTIMDNCGLAVIRNQYFCSSAKKMIHVNMCRNPCLLFFIDKCFYISILAVSHDPYKKVSICYFTSIRIYDVSGVSSPINLYLFTRFSVYMHGCATFFFFLLKIIAELRIHKCLFVI